MDINKRYKKCTMCDGFGQVEVSMTKKKRNEFIVSLYKKVDTKLISELFSISHFTIYKIIKEHHEK